MKSSIKTVADALKKQRRLKGLTQAVVFKETGIHIARIEMGNVNMRLSTIFELSTYYEIEAADLFK